MVELTPLGAAAIAIGGFFGLILFMLFVISFCSRLGKTAEDDGTPPRMPGIIAYLKHKHLLLSLIWSGPIIKFYDRHYMNRARYIVLFTVVLLLNFVVCGIIFASSQPSTATVDCALLAYCRNSCPSCPASPYRVGLDRRAGNFVMAANTPGYGNCTRFSPAGPCFRYCRSGARAEYRVDERPTCSSLGTIPTDIICMEPKSVAVCSERTVSVGSAKIPVTFNAREIALRVILTVLIVFPAQWAIKALMRCTYRSGDGCCSCIGRSLGYLLIIGFVVLTGLVVYLLLRSLQNGDLWGAVAVSFLIAFAIGLVLDIPKLVLIYACFDKRKLAKRYLYCYSIFLAIQQKKADEQQQKIDKAKKQLQAKKQQGTAAATSKAKAKAKATQKKTAEPARKAPKAPPARPSSAKARSGTALPSSSRAAKPPPARPSSAKARSSTAAPRAAKPPPARPSSAKARSSAALRSAPRAAKRPASAPARTAPRPPSSRR